jgi:hypothetical protein
VCVVVGVVNLLVLDDEALRYIDQGHEVAELVIDGPIPEGQTAIPYVGQAFRPDAWLSYYTGLRPIPLRDADEIVDLSRRRPDDQVVILGWCEETDASYDLCRSLVQQQDLVVDGRTQPQPHLERAADLARRASS